MINFPTHERRDQQEIERRAKEKMAIMFKYRLKQQKHSSNIHFEKDDLVYLRVPHQSKADDKVTSKFCDIYSGPYRIARDYGNGAYQLVEPDDPGIDKGVHNQANLRPCIKLVDENL